MSIPVSTGPGTGNEGWGHRLSAETQIVLQSVDYSGQTALVTGTTNGLGSAVARKLLLRRISKLIMGVRNVARGEEFKKQLLQDAEIQAANPLVEIDVVEIEMESFESVVAFVQKLEATEKRIDIAIMNAAVGGVAWNVSPSGHERMLQVNVLSTSLLALRLVPLLKKTAEQNKTPSKLAMIGSWMQFNSSIPDALPFPGGVLAYLDDEAKFNGLTRYPDTQLLNALVVEELAPRVDKSLISIVEPTPPWTRTNFGQNYPAGPGREFAIRMFEERGLPLDDAADTYMYALHVATDAHGQFLDDNTICPRNPVVETPEGKALQKALWAEMMTEFAKYDESFSKLDFVQ